MILEKIVDTYNRKKYIAYYKVRGGQVWQTVVEINAEIMVAICVCKQILQAVEAGCLVSRLF